MGCSRNGQGANLTPVQARQQLSEPVLEILRGSAIPVFPHTSLAAPSEVVRIQLLPGNLQGRGSVLYPFFVGGKQWDVAVVPVLEDPRWISEAFRLLPMELQRNLVGEALALSFHNQGYGPL